MDTPGTKKATIRDQLLQIARAHDQTNRIASVWFHPSFPVDVRHNATIHRPELPTCANTAS